MDDDAEYEPTSPWWLSGTPLEAEHHRLMRRRAVAIPWAATTVAQLADGERARLAATWGRRAAAEYLAVSTFSVLAIDLVAAMAPADVLSLCLRAGIDEVRHAEMCLRMMEIYSGKRELPPPGMSRLPDEPGRPKLHQALANTMLVSCVSETYATTVLTATRDVTEDPTAREVLTAIYSDEVMHARLGWSYLRHAIEVGGQGVIDAAAQMLPRALRGVANVVERERPEGAVTDAVRAHGLMTPQEERVIFSSCVRDVLVPGFEAMNIPVGSAVDDYGDAWASAGFPTDFARSARSSILLLIAVAACTPAATAPAAQCPVAPPPSMADRVVHDFEAAVLSGKDAYVSLFDFKTIGEVEILLHRYDLNGRTSERLAKRRAEFEAEDGTPYPEARERRNVGNFYPLFVKRTVGTGGCTAVPPRTRYARLLGTYFDPLPASTPAAYETLRTHANDLWRAGGAIGIHCTGGHGNLAVVYTQRPNARGYDLITIYDD